MLEAFAQLFLLVSAEVDNRDPTVSAQDAGSLAQRHERIDRIMQHLVQQDRVEALAFEGKRQEIALYEFDLIGRKVLEPGARDAQHLETFVERDDPPGILAEQLGHAPRPGTDIEQFAQRLSGERPTPAAVADTDRERVGAALASLPGGQRLALTLRYLDEYSVAEVADELDTTYSAAESLLARARRSFERAWEEK